MLTTDSYTNQAFGPQSELSLLATGQHHSWGPWSQGLQGASGPLLERSPRRASGTFVPLLKGRQSSGKTTSEATCRRHCQKAGSLPNTASLSCEDAVNAAAAAAAAFSVSMLSSVRSLLGTKGKETEGTSAPLQQPAPRSTTVSAQLSSLARGHGTADPTHVSPHFT